MGFLSGVYSTAFGFTEAFGEDRAKYVGVSGILIGIGEICGALLFLPKYTMIFFFLFFMSAG